MTDTSNESTTTSSGIRVQMRPGLHRWYNIWAGYELDTRVMGTVTHVDEKSQVYEVRWDGHGQPVYVAMSHVERLAPGEGAMPATRTRRGMMFK